MRRWSDGDAAAATAAAAVDTNFVRVPLVLLR